MPKEMLIFIKRAGAFLFGLLIILTCIELQLRKNLDSHEERHFQELFHSQQPADVIIIGSSTAVHGINPRFLENVQTSAGDFSRIYNFALRGGQMNFWKQWYDLLFTQYYSKPSLVIISVDWFGFAGDNRVEGLEPYSRYFPFDVFVDVLLSKDAPDKISLWMNRFNFFSSRREIFHVFSAKTDFGDLRMDKYYRGFVPLERTINTGQPPAIKDASWDETLEKLIDDLQAHDMRIVLIQTPNYIPGRVMRGVDTNALLRKLAEAKGIPLLNYNEERASKINYTPDYYADYAHMNETGSNTFSKILKTDLEEILKGASPSLLK